MKTWGYFITGIYVCLIAVGCAKNVWWIDIGNVATSWDYGVCEMQCWPVGDKGLLCKEWRVYRGV